MRFLDSGSWLLVPIGAAILVVCTSLLTPIPIAAQQVQSYQPNPKSNFRNSVTQLGRSFRARPSRVAPIETTNFVVYATDEQLARKVSKEAERFRKELSIEWLGREIPTWRHKCPIKVEIGNNAGGETSFAFIAGNSGRGEPIDWSMKIYGPPDRLLDAVLPHEVTHTIFATHFGRPLPRWADEGACTTVEHESERRKNHRMLLEFLTAQPSRGIPFNRMFTMRNYPHDILPLYAQGYSLARFLIAKEGRRHFVDYVAKGLENENRTHELRAWDEATREFYQYEDLSELQIDWLAWVKNGSSESQPGGPDLLNSMAKFEPNLRASRYPNSTPPDNHIVAASFAELPPKAPARPVGLEFLSSSSNAVSKLDAKVASQPHTFSRSNSKPSDSWYIREMNRDTYSTAGSDWKHEEPVASANRIASQARSLSSNQARKVPTNTSTINLPPSEHDTRLPNQFRPPSTLWR